MDAWNRMLLAALLATALAGCTAASPSVLSTERGRLLYNTACLACHTTQAHWRDKPVVQSWDGLRREVDRWQRNSGQRWSEDEIDDVSAYLNGLFYHLPCTRSGCAGAAS